MLPRCDLQIGATLQKDVPCKIRIGVSQLTIVDSFLLKNESLEIGQD